MQWQDFLAAFGLYLVFEGLLPFISPDGFKRFLANILQMAPGQLRTMGAISIGLGLLLLYWVRQG